MGNTTTAFIIVMCINLLLWLGQVAVLAHNPDAGVTFANYEGNPLNDGEVHGYVLNSTNPFSSGTTISTGSGDDFGDSTGTILSWLEKIPGLGWLIKIFAAPYNFLQAIGLPSEFVYGLGTAWYLITLIIIALMIAWRGE